MRRPQNFDERVARIVAVTLTVIVFGAVGTVLLVSSQAASLTASVEAENSTLTPAATNINDATASNGQAVKFGAGSSGATQTNNCVPNPHLCGFPDATNTGVPASTTLTASGSVTVTTAGTTVQNLNISGCIDVEADNVTIKNVKITCSDYYAIQDFSGHTGLVVEDSEIIGTGTQVASGINGSNFTAIRLNIHGMGDGIDGGDNVIVRDSYVHDLASDSETHNDDYQNTGGVNTTLQHNTFFNKNNAASCVMFGSENGSPSTVVVTDNILDGGSYSLYLDTKGTNRTITNNRIGRDFIYGSYDTGGTYTASGNVWDDSGAINNP